MHKYFKIIFTFILLFVLSIKVYLLINTPLDSDEVMWSVMADNINKHNANYWFFTDQNFRGSFESYFIAPFQSIFGISEITLRFNSLIFTILTAILIYIIIYYSTKKQYLSFLGSIFFLIPLPSIYFIYNKAWGGYISIQFFMLLVYYLYYLNVVNKNSEKFNFYVPFLGLISGISFWINEQSIYFIFIVILLSLLFDIKKFKLLNRFNKSIYVLLFFSYAFIIYSIIKKQMFLNVQNSFVQKMGLNFEFLNINIYLKDFIFLTFGLLLFFTSLNLFFKKFDFVKGIFLNYCSYVFLVLTINIHFNSFSRLYTTEPKDYYKSINFLYEIIIKNIFGPFWLLFFLAGLLLLILRLKNLYKVRDYSIKLKDFFIISFFAFPIMFLLSSVPGLSDTPRYLLLWWPVSVLILFFAAFKIFKSTTKIVTFFITFILLWFFNIYFIFNIITDNIVLKKAQDNAYIKLVNQINNSDKNTCVGNYWNVSLVFFYSNSQIKCFTSKEYGHYYKFLDQYKIEDMTKVYIVN